MLVQASILHLQAAYTFPAQDWEKIFSKFATDRPFAIMRFKDFLYLLFGDFTVSKFNSVRRICSPKEK